MYTVRASWFVETTDMQQLTIIVSQLHIMASLSTSGTEVIYRICRICPSRNVEDYGIE